MARLMANRFTFLAVLNNSKVQLCLIFMFALVAAFWQYSPFMPEVFYGDDLGYILAFKDGQCGTVASQILTTVCADKFRPVAAGFILLLFNLFDSTITHYMTVNVLLQAISATLVFAIAYHLSKSNFVVALCIAITVATSRFAAYQVTQVIGPVEGLALPLFLAVVYSVIRADERQEDTWRFGWAAILLSFLLIHNHERYILISAWLGVVFILLPNFRVLPRKYFVALIAACVALPVFYVTYKITVLHSPFLVGTGGSHLDFDSGRMLEHLRQAVLPIFGFNTGPDYLVGVRLRSLHWFPAWILASMFFITIVLVISLGVKSALNSQAKSILIQLSSIRWPILLFVLSLLLLLPAISTIRVEQRWLFAPFILMLLAVAWAVGQKQRKVRTHMWPLIIILSVSSILLDLTIMKHFNNLFFVYSARFAEMAKRDIADKYPGQTWSIELVAAASHCDWTLQNGGFFRLYGGQQRQIKCITTNDISGDGEFDSRTRVFAELSPGYLSDITNERQKRTPAEHNKF